MACRDTQFCSDSRRLFVACVRTCGGYFFAEARRRIYVRALKIRPLFRFYLAYSAQFTPAFSRASSEAPRTLLAAENARVFRQRRFVSSSSLQFGSAVALMCGVPAANLFAAAVCRVNNGSFVSGPRMRWLPKGRRRSERKGRANTRASRRAAAPVCRGMCQRTRRPCHEWRVSTSDLGKTRPLLYGGANCWRTEEEVRLREKNKTVMVQSRKSIAAAHNSGIRCELRAAASGPMGACRICTQPQRRSLWKLA